ncbi:3502_t:CDS:2 [Funneliformis geosporum]|uniref:3502_t:CDS:1 n=1 Tax=Funneliformis geosporum TaxID=1117311 RepID=A0A9W4SXT0_9GLOM|nr:3502_t:CDS:2 [Funneliformis geosporum]
MPGRMKNFNKDSGSTATANAWPREQSSVNKQLRSTTYLRFVSPNFEGVHIYFKNVEAQNWQLKHYLHYRLKQDNVILSWMDVYDDWKKSLNVIIKNSTKKIPGSVHTNLERIQELEKSLFSSQKISQHFRISTRGKKRAHDDNNKEVSQCGKRSRQNVGFLNPSWVELHPCYLICYQRYLFLIYCL